MKEIKAILNKLHEWIGDQSVIVQIGIAACSAFLAVALLIAAFS